MRHASPASGSRPAMPLAARPSHQGGVDHRPGPVAVHLHPRRHRDHRIPGSAQDVEGDELLQLPPPHPLPLEAFAHRFHHVARPLLLHGARRPFEESPDPVLVGGAGAEPSPRHQRAEEDRGDEGGEGQGFGRCACRRSGGRRDVIGVDSGPWRKTGTGRPRPISTTSGASSSPTAAGSRRPRRSSRRPSPSTRPPPTPTRTWPWSTLARSAGGRPCARTCTPWRSSRRAPGPASPSPPSSPTTASRWPRQSTARPSPPTPSTPRPTWSWGWRSRTWGAPTRG